MTKKELEAKIREQELFIRELYTRLRALEEKTKTKAEREAELEKKGITKRKALKFY